MAFVLFSSLGWGQIAAWDFFGQSSPATFAATTFNSNLVSTSAQSNITRGSNATSSSGSNSFRTQGFSNNGIATSNTDYFEITLTAATNYKLSLSTIDAKVAGTATYCVTPGVSNQFAYSLDGTTFTLIGSAQLIIGTPGTLTQIDLTGITALQNVAAGTKVTLRYYASGQTSSGGWGFASATAGSNGLAIGGTVTPATTSPTISGATTAAAFTTTYGTASAVQTFSISGVNLTADITATAPTGFLVSSDGTSYGTTATFPRSGNSVSGSLRIILASNATVSGSYNSQNIVLSSTGATDANIATTATGNSVTPAPLTILGLSASNKPYDRTTSVTVSGSAAFSGLKNGETFTPSGTVTWAFADALVASGKTVTRTGTFTAPNTNYTVSQPSLTASISALALTTSGTAAVTPKTYDRTTSATITGIALIGAISPDVVTIVGTYDTKTVNTGKAVTLVLSGADSANYSWTAPSVTGDITSATVTVSGATVSNKINDGTNTATFTGTLVGVVLGDTVTLNGTGTFSSTAIGNGISVTSTATLSGADAGNYTLTQPIGLTGNIIVQEAGLLLLEDNFNYTGTLIVNGYTASSGTGTNNLTTGAAGLTYSNYGSSSIGNALAVANTGEDVYKTFPQQNTPNTIYTSFLVNVSVSRTGDYFFVFAPSAGTTTFRARTFIKTSSNSGFFNIGIGNTGTATYGTTDLALNTTYLIVVKYSFISGVSAVCTIFVNPSTNSEPTTSEATVTDNTTANAPADITSFTIRQGTTASSPTLVMDGIRVATNWGSLLGNPQYSTTSNIAAGNYNTVNVISGAVTALGNVASKTLNINASGSLAVTTGNNLTIDGAITNNGTLTIANNANLIQTALTNTNSGTGTATVNRNSASINLYDYTLWSSPVAGQNLRTFSNSTLAARFYTYNSSTNYYSAVDFTTPVNFATATGYLIRTPNDWTANTPTTFNGVFTGVPNNGDIPFTMVDGGIGKRFNLVGNPYPSPITISSFVTDNTANITGTLYFWRKTNGSGTAYCTYSGSTFVTNGNAQSATPNGVIQTGQGFFVEGNGVGTALTFKNSQRVANTANQFFRTNLVENNRIWLNLTNTTGVFSQMAVGYMTDATQGVDSLDGKYINDAPIALTSIINADEYTIQGRALPFATTDTVPLGFKTNAAGNYTIAIDHVDGLFSTGQTIYLKDNLLNTVVDLSEGNYSFASAVGTFNSRFEVVYQSTLGATNPTFTANSVIAFSENGEIKINSGSTIMELVRVYDLQGRLLAEKNQINASETKITTTATNQVLLVEITATNGNKITKKIIQ